MTALQIDQVFIKSSAIDTSAAVERGAIGRCDVVGMGVLKGAGCNGNAGKVRRARRRVRWRMLDGAHPNPDTVRIVGSTKL